MSEPGWKPHPTDAGWERYWDGTQWTGEPRRSGNSTDEPKSRSSRWVAIGAVILAVAAAGVGGLMLLREDSDSAAVMPTERTSNGGTVEGARKTLAEMFSALLSRDYEGWCSAQGSIGQAYWANKQREIASSSGATSGSDLDDCVEYGRKVAAGPEIAQFDQMRKEAATVPITMNGSEATISGWASRGGPLTMSWIADQWEVSWGASGSTTSDATPQESTTQPSTQTGPSGDSSCGQWTDFSIVQKLEALTALTDQPRYKQFIYTVGPRVAVRFVDYACDGSLHPGGVPPGGVQSVEDALVYTMTLANKPSPRLLNGCTRDAPYPQRDGGCANSPDTSR